MIAVSTLTPDSQFNHFEYRLSELDHFYGSNVHILSDLFQLSHLTRLCAEETTQPMVNELVGTLYSSLLKTVVNCEFPRTRVAVRTRMADSQPEGVFQGPGLDSEVDVVSVNLARAGTFPSHICYSSLNYFMNPKRVRQDHISIARTTDGQEKVTGSRVSGHKIGGSVQDAIVLFPDPMGATGGTLSEAVDLYRLYGKAKKLIALHCIVTPEYLKSIQSKCPELIVYAVRLDRGLSAPEVLNSVLGSRWDLERGLNDKHYIVPGGGGFGEIMNNAYA